MLFHLPGKSRPGKRLPASGFYYCKQTKKSEKQAKNKNCHSARSDPALCPSDFSGMTKVKALARDLVLVLKRHLVLQPGRTGIGATACQAVCLQLENGPQLVIERKLGLVLVEEPVQAGVVHVHVGFQAVVV